MEGGIITVVWVVSDVSDANPRYCFYRGCSQCHRTTILVPLWLCLMSAIYNIDPSVIVSNSPPPPPRYWSLLDSSYCYPSTILGPLCLSVPNVSPELTAAPRWPRFFFFFFFLLLLLFCFFCIS